MTSYDLWMTQTWYHQNAFQSALPGLVLLTLLACGSLQPTQEEQFPSLEMESAFLQGENGLGTNGLGTSGLSASAMNSSEFVTWFNQNPALADKVMTYVVSCAVAENSLRTWTNPLTGLQYSWNGSLGLTPGWAGGAPITGAEQQLMTACLAAHTNKYGIRVPISIQGRTANDSLIPVTADELTTFARQEACFFGNLFTAEGIFSGSDGNWATTESSVRACGLEKPGATVDKCPPIHHLGSCRNFCILDTSRTAYLSCTYNGKDYRPMTTRIRREDVYRCGDSICQFTESCGTGLSPEDCRDCGPCQ
jgi:hypothetical protein